MIKCVYCQERKGKRPCPALNGNICSQCCGTYRMEDIRCPPDCHYLDSNFEYQQKRVGDQFEQGRQNLYKDLLELGGDKAAEVFYLLESIIFKHFHERRDGQDGEVIAAIQALRRTFSPIHIPDVAVPPFTETLKKEYNAFMEGQKVDTQLVGEVIDRGLAFMDDFSGKGLRSSRFINGLVGYLKSRHPEVAQQLAKLGTSEGRILLPPNAPYEGSTSPIIS